MASIKIDNMDFDTLSDEANAAVLKTARASYSKGLQAALPSQLEQAKADETLKFN